MKGRRVSYSPDEMRWLDANRTMVIGDYHRAFVARFGRAGVTAGHLHSLRKRKGWKPGRTGLFEKGAAPANKGKKTPYNENSARTRFKKGCRVGRANAVYKPIGTERVSKDGYVERKINDDLPFEQRWRAVHLVRWKGAHGPVPEGMVLKCMDGDRRNTDPDNWKPIPRAMLPRLNGRFGRGYDRAPAALKPTIMTIARLEVASIEHRRGKKNPKPAGRRRRALSEGRPA